MQEYIILNFSNEENQVNINVQDARERVIILPGKNSNLQRSILDLFAISFLRPALKSDKNDTEIARNSNIDTFVVYADCRLIPRVASGRG